MCIFTHDHGSVVILTEGIVTQLPNGVVHGGIDIGGLSQVSLLEHHRTRVVILQPFIGSYKVDTIPALIPHGPHDYRGKVFMNLIEPTDAVNIAALPQGVIGNVVVVIIGCLLGSTQAVGLNVGLSNHIQSHAVAQGIEIGIIRIV
jgi:hypothetical protein